MTITCSQFKAYLDEYLDGTTSPLLTQTLEQHVSACEACRQLVVAAKTLQQQLREMPYPPPSQDFEARVLKKIHSDTAPLRRYAIAAVIVISLMTWFALSPPVGERLVANQDVMRIELSVEQIQHIDLVFHSPVDIEQATIRLELPRHIELAGQGDKQFLQWEIALRKGSNRLTLPLIAHGMSEGQLIASIGSSGKTKTFRVTVSTKLPQSSTTSVLPVV